MSEKLLFTEKQYMGHNKLSLIWRTVLAGFCFLGYYWSEHPNPINISVFHINYHSPLDIENPGKMFLLLGILILFFSIMLTFILHTHTQVYSNYILIDGFWTARRVKINLNTIIHIRKSKYKKHIFRRTVYNLHSKGVIRFFTSGNEFVELRDDCGFTYRIGSQRTPELYQILRKQLFAIHQL